MIEVTDPDTNVKRWYTCSPDARPTSDCGDHPRVAARDITWEMDPPDVEEEGDGQKVRRELEPGDPDTPDDDQWWLRGIRTTAGLVTSTDETVGALGLVGKAYGARSGAVVEVKRPSHLGRCGTVPSPCLAWFDNQEVDLERLIIDAADQYGMPPQYLAAQMVGEAGRTKDGKYVNAYAFRYEPTSRDFKMLGGDWSNTVSGGTRRLLDPQQAFFRLGATKAGPVEYLPCEKSDGSACIEAEPPPSWSEPVELEGVSDAVFRIPLAQGTLIQLWVRVDTPAGLTQDFDGPCASMSLATETYCVDADAHTVRFGLAPASTPIARYRVVEPVTKPPDAQFGSLISVPSAVIDDICRFNPPGNIVPCDPSTGAALDPTITIRQWARLMPHRDFLTDGHTLQRYNRESAGDGFKNEELEALVRNDPSFEVQAQWFAASSYGVMQMIPHDFQTVLLPRVPPEEQEHIKRDYYDPMRHSPADRLFDPDVCVPMGALFDASVELQFAEVQNSTCDKLLEHVNQCTWINLWKHRFCKYNIGREDDDPAAGRFFCSYAETIIERSDAYAPQP
jgi:hypothetical protein